MSVPPDDLDLAALLARGGPNETPGPNKTPGPSETTGLGSAAEWEPMGPLVGRLARKDADGPVRLRRTTTRLTALGVVPSGALVGRTVETQGGDRRSGVLDATVRAGALLAFLDGGPAPARDDAAWRIGLPPAAGWRVIDTVPDAVVRDLVRQGALAHVEAAGREFGARGADALLDAVVLTARDGSVTVELTNRELAAVTSMGFLPRGGHVQVGVSGRWNRVAAPFGSVFTERAGAALTML